MFVCISWKISLASVLFGAWPPQENMWLLILAALDKKQFEMVCVGYDDVFGTV